MRNLLSTEQNTLFDERMQHWQARLGLIDWRIERVPGRASKAMAEVNFDHEARLATYRTGDFGPDEITAASIDRIALHEALHVLLAELLHLTVERVDTAMLASAEHRVVHVLERLLAP